MSGVMLALFFILSFLYSLTTSRLEMEEGFRAEVEKSYEEAIKTEMSEKFRKEGHEEGYKSAEPDPALLEQKQKVEKQLLGIKQKALEEMEGYNREKICKIAYRAGVARGESDAKKHWRVEYWDEKTGVGIGKLLSFGKKVVRLQLIYRDFPVGAPVEVDVEKEVELDNSAVCGLLKGLQWANPTSYQFIEGVKSEVCGKNRIKKGDIIPKEEANEKFWDSLPSSK